MFFSSSLLNNSIIQEIFNKRDFLKQLTDEDYYETLDFFNLEEIKAEIGPLVKFLKGEKLMYGILAVMILAIPVAKVCTQAILSESNIKVERMRKDNISYRKKMRENA